MGERWVLNIPLLSQGLWPPTKLPLCALSPLFEMGCGRWISNVLPTLGYEVLSRMDMKLLAYPIFTFTKFFLIYFSRIGEGLDQALPCLTELILTNNSLVELVS